MLGDIGKAIFKNTATAYGTRLIVERVLPSAENMGKKLIKKIKNLKNKEASEEASVEAGEEQKFRPAESHSVSRPGRIVDVEVDS